MPEILVKIDDDALEALHKCISLNKMCGRLMPEFDEMHALSIFVAGAIHKGWSEVKVFKIIPREEAT